MYNPREPDISDDPLNVGVANPNHICELVIEGKHLSSIVRRIRRDYDE